MRKVKKGQERKAREGKRRGKRGRRAREREGRGNESERVFSYEEHAEGEK